MHANSQLTSIAFLLASLTSCFGLSANNHSIQTDRETRSVVTGRSTSGSVDESYLVVSLAPPENEFYSAAKLLAERHNSHILQTSAATIDDVLPELTRRNPKTVVFVVSPDQLELNLVRKIFHLSTRIDDDPFVDFAYGFVTGRDGDAACKLVQSASLNRPTLKPAITLLGVGSSVMGKSRSEKAAWPLRGCSIAVQSHTSIGDTDETTDKAFLEKVLPQLKRPPILLLASHGYPDGLVGGPKASDLRHSDLAGAIVFNMACYNGVTSTWFEDDYASGVVRQRTVSPDDSFCLSILDSGLAAYFAYVSPRPSGPTMMGDSMIVASAGISTGEFWQAEANRIVLAHLMAGEQSVSADPIRDGQELPAERTPAEMVKQMSTGGLLFGDPSFVPFPEIPNSDPRILMFNESATGLELEFKVASPIFHFFTAETVNYWQDQSAAIRLEAVIPVAGRQVTAIRVVELPIENSEFKFVAAEELDNGQRRLRLKLTCPQPSEMAKLQRLIQKGVKAKFEISTSPRDDASSDAFQIWRGNEAHPIAEEPRTPR